MAWRNIPENWILELKPESYFLGITFEEFGYKIRDIGDLPEPLSDFIRNACIKSHRCSGHAGNLSQVRLTQLREICDPLVIRLAVSIQLK